MWIFICSVLIEVRAELSYPPLAINLGVPSDRARRCYFREQVWWKVINILTQVNFIGTRWNKKLTRKSSRCAAVQKSIKPTTDHHQSLSLDPTLDQQSLSLDITTDQLSLGLKTTNCQVSLRLDLQCSDHVWVIWLQEPQSSSGEQCSQVSFDMQRSPGSSWSESFKFSSGCKESQISSGELSPQHSTLTSGPEGSQSSPETSGYVWV